MRILKYGRDEFLGLYRFECINCGCVFEAIAGDGVESWVDVDTQSLKHSIKCPCCSCMITNGSFNYKE